MTQDGAATGAAAGGAGRAAMDGADGADGAAMDGAAMDGAVERYAARTADVAGMAVRRALPQRRRRTVGAWCFADHFGPRAVSRDDPVAIGPHPHIGLHTVTWLVTGEQRHRDSLGSDQVIRPGQLNLMTAGAGVAHAEESQAYRGELHGVQLWVAQPEATRWGAARFEHLPELPAVELGSGTGTVLVGAVGGTRSPARADLPLLGVDLDLRPGACVLPLDPAFEHGVLVLDGEVAVAGEAAFRPGSLAYLPTGRDELGLTAGPEGARALLLGGAPFGEGVVMWWNFVARSSHEVAEARAAWADGSDRFGPVATAVPPVPAPGLPTPAAGR